MTRCAHHRKSVIGPFAMLGSISTIALIPTGAVAQQAPSQQARALTCVELVLAKNIRGKAVVKVPGSLVTQSDPAAGELIIEVDLKCVGDTNSASMMPDKYAELRRVADGVIEQSGLPPNKKEQVKDRLNGTIDGAQKDNKDPIDDLQTANTSNAEAGEKSGDKDTAMLAAIGAVAAACMVASAGVCSAAALAILPSLLPPDVSNKDIAGVVRAVQNASQGRPISVDDMATVQKVLNKGAGKLETQGMQRLNTFLENGGPILQGEITKVLKINPANVEAGIKFLRSAVLRSEFKCDDLQRAMSMQQAVRVRSEERNAIIDMVMNNITVLRNSDRVSGDIRKCLGQIIVSS